MTHFLDIGPSLVVARRAAGVSQRELAERLGTSQQQVARWERSRYRHASLERVAAVAEALGVEAPYLPIAAEAPAAYSATLEVAPVRDLGEVVARIRAHGEEIHSRFGWTRLGVFGSFVTGEQTAQSDVDLLVEVDDPKGFVFVDGCIYMERLLGREVDVAQEYLLKDRIRGRIMREVLYVWDA